MTDKELRILDEMLTNLEIWSTWNKTFANEMIGICSKMRNLLADRKTEPQTMPIKKTMTGTHRERIEYAEAEMVVDDEPTMEEWEELQDWKDRMWAEAVIEPQTERSE